MTSPILAAARDALQAHLPPHVRVLIVEDEPRPPTLELHCTAEDTCVKAPPARLTLGKGIRFNVDRLVTTACVFAESFVKQHQHPDLAGASSTERAEASPAGSTLRPLPGAAQVTGDVERRAPVSLGRLPDGTVLIASPDAPPARLDAGQIRPVVPERAWMPTRTGALFPPGRGPAVAEPALIALARVYGVRAAGRLEQVRAMAGRCARLWASNPGLTGWRARAGMAGANLAALLVEEQLIGRMAR